MMSRRKSLSNLPSENSFAAWMIALPERLFNSFKDMFASAAAIFTNPSDFLKVVGIFRSEIWKLLSALAVNAP